MLLAVELEQNFVKDHHQVEEGLILHFENGFLTKLNFQAFRVLKSEDVWIRQNFQLGPESIQLDMWKIIFEFSFVKEMV